jgi:hypothetical protein
MIAWVHPSKLFAALILVSAALLSWSQLAQAQVHQQGPKLVGTGAAGHFPVQVQSVALSADGNTAVVGGPFGNNGAAWVWTRSGGVWTQQGTKLVGSGAVGAGQGNSVALSTNGNTAIVGGLATTQAPERGPSIAQRLLKVTPAALLSPKFAGIPSPSLGTNHPFGDLKNTVKPSKIFRRQLSLHFRSKHLVQLVHRLFQVQRFAAQHRFLGASGPEPGARTAPTRMTVRGDEGRPVGIATVRLFYGCLIQKPIAATHPPFAATVTVRRGRLNRSTCRGNDLRSRSSPARSARGTVAQAVGRSRNRRANRYSFSRLSGSLEGPQARSTCPSQVGFPPPVGRQHEGRPPGDASRSRQCRSAGRSTASGRRGAPLAAIEQLAAIGDSQKNVAAL